MFCSMSGVVRKRHGKGMNMKLNIRNMTRFLMIMLVGLSTIKCGNDNGGRIRIVSNGQTYEDSLKNTRCEAGAPSGNSLYNLPVICSAGFRNLSTSFSDSIVVTITDVRAIGQELGNYIPLSPSLLNFSVTVGGTQLAITNGGAVFSEVSNIQGERNCFDFEIDSAQVHLEGSFCQNNVVGY